MLPVVVFPFLDMLNLDVHDEAFGHELKLVPEAFNHVRYGLVGLHVMYQRLSRLEFVNEVGDRGPDEGTPT